MPNNINSEIEHPKSEIVMLFHKIYSSVFGIGFIKGGGSIAAAVTGLLWYFAWHGATPPLMISLIVTAIITLIGVWSSSIVESVWGKDPSKVVIDEVSGMCIGMLFVPVNVTYLLCAFILFRFFDIVKPLYVRKMELLPSGWGVMMDDVLAGVYTNILLQIVLWFEFF